MKKGCECKNKLKQNACVFYFETAFRNSISKTQLSRQTPTIGRRLNSAERRNLCRDRSNGNVPSIKAHAYRKVTRQPSKLHCMSWLKGTLWRDPDKNFFLCRTCQYVLVRRDKPFLIKCYIGRLLLVLSPWSFSSFPRAFSRGSKLNERGTRTSWIIEKIDGEEKRQRCKTDAPVVLEHVGLFVSVQILFPFSFRRMLDRNFNGNR